MDTNTTVSPSRAPRHYDLLLAGMVAVLLCSNLIGPAKVCRVAVPGFGPVDFGAGNLFFPIGYIFSDVMTEVYGYARARRAIWAGFGALAFATLMTTVVLAMPPSPVEPFNKVLQPALQTALGSTWRIVAASMLAYWAGDFVNSYVMAKMKVWTNARWLWTRTIGSTIVGQAVDSALFYPVAFYGIWETHTLLAVLGFNFLFKVGVEVVATPVTYRIVAFLKKAEGGPEVFDSQTRFTPFTLTT